jgi:dihydropteroate synthase
LNNVARDLTSAIKNYRNDNPKLILGKHKFNFKTRSYIMGIINVTPDSFSGDGMYSTKTSDIAEYAEKLVNEGADIIDIGGESTRPGAKPVSLKDELLRVIPAVNALSKKIKVPISVDTYKPEVAKQALENGAAIINDITALRNIKMAKVIAAHKAGVVLMHMLGNPRSMQKNPKYTSLIDEISCYLSAAIKKAQDCGIDKDKIIIDPGIGFGKTLGHNLEILKRLREFKLLGKPILIGTSRKSFLGTILNEPADKRIFGTVASSVLACENGANIIRAHDVAALKQALLIKDRVAQ